MNRGKGAILALALAALTGCASSGGAPGAGDTTVGGTRPADNTYTRTAGVHLAQATTMDGEEARQQYQAAVDAALQSIEAEPGNAKGYLLAGQAAVGTGDFIRADTMFDRAEALYPGYADQIVSEREQGWVQAYNTGIEHVNAQNIEAARDLFAAADRLYQARPEARMNLGWANMRLGNTEGAIEAYRGALEILHAPAPAGLDEEQVAGWARDRRIASFNLATLLAQNGQPGEAADVLGDFLARNQDTLDSPTALQAMTAQANFLAQAGRTQEAETLMASIRQRSDLSSADHFQVGIGLFNTGDYAAAAEAFGKSAELNPYSRDALLNLVQSLYSEALDLEKEPASAERDARMREIYMKIVEAADQVRSFDPLNRNLLSFMLRANRGLEGLSNRTEAERFRQASQDLFRAYQAQEYEVADISLNLQGGDVATVTGVLTNLNGQAGAQVRLRFTAVDRNGGEIDSEVVAIALPAVNEAVEFRTGLDLSSGEFAGWKYEVLP
ncbi:MAG TPA: tetratricopeptide repeat protein [Longimicrobiales bacterium]|nr:tetratricopeptide repeat protein [Longimicrobiales bacterium]